MEEPLYTKEEVIKLCFMAYNLRTSDASVRTTQQLNKWIDNELKIIHSK